MASYRLTALVILVIALLCVTQAATVAPPASIQDVTTLAEFNRIIKSNEKVVVFYYANWADKSRKVVSTFEQFAAQNAKSVVSIKVNWDTAQEIYANCSISTVPALRLYLKKGKLAKELTGAYAAAVQEFYASAK